MSPTRWIRPGNYTAPRIGRFLSPLRVAGLLALSGCGDETGPKPDVTWEGVVTSSATGAPISGASVVLEDWTTLSFVPPVLASTSSDAQGGYSITRQGCVRVPYLVVGAPGYTSINKPVACRAGTVTTDISLTPSP